MQKVLKCIINLLCLLSQSYSFIRQLILATYNTQGRPEEPGAGVSQNYMLLKIITSKGILRALMSCIADLGQ